MLAIHHLGYKIPGEPEYWLNRGFDVAVDYFCGDWWKDDPDVARVMDKSQKQGRLKWFGAFSSGILLGLLSERWEELAKVCNWVEAGMKAESRQYEIWEEPEAELPLVYLSVAASLRSEPMPGLARMEARIEAGQDLRTNLLFQAWKAARAGDKPTFDEALVRSLAQFSATSGVGPTPLHWIATHQSVVGLAAARLGIAAPQLPPTLEAVLMTRASLGLGEVQGGSRVPSKSARPKDGGETSDAAFSPEYVETLVEEFKASRGGSEEISSRQLTWTLRGLARAKAESAKRHMPFDLASAEAWFRKHTVIRSHFESEDQFLRSLELALKILQSDE